ncbi:MAG: transposase [Saprospiraceae bacterium]
MKLIPNQVYHVYNRGNNRQPIFFEKDNYYYFLRKLKAYISPNCDLLAYCLMPNHFHLLIHVNDRSVKPHPTGRQPSLRRKNRKPKRLTYFSWGLKQLLSSYTKGINKKYARSGSLFQQNTKSKMTSSESLLDDYSAWCFIYIHNNPKTAGLVTSPEEYEFTSFNEFLNDRKDSVCNIPFASELLCLERSQFSELKTLDIPEDVAKKIF